MGAAPAWAASACRRGEARSRAADEEESAAVDHARPVRALLRSLAFCRTASFVMPPWQEPGARVPRRYGWNAGPISGEASKRRRKQRMGALGLLAGRRRELERSPLSDP